MKKNLLLITLTVLLIFSMLSANMIGITVAQETHDIAIVSVTPYPTKVGLGLSELVNVTVIIENQGTENENVTVTVYYDTTTNETQNVVDQPPNTNTTLTFTWNTTGITMGTYTINATASLPEDSDTTDNTLTSTVDVVSSYVTVLPRNIVDFTLTQGQNYTISIYTNYNGSDIWGYEFTLTYNPAVLRGIEAVNGDLITQAVTTFNAGNFNNTLGTLSKTGAYALNMTPTPPEPLASTGPGILANITFTIVGEGKSFITLGDDTLLMDTDGEGIIDLYDDLDPDLTRGKFLHGTFRNAPEAIHDVAVLSIESSVTLVYKGDPVTINVTIGNKGNASEFVRVRVYYGYDPISDEPLYPIGSPGILTLENATNATISFIWDTTDAVTGTHALTARAELLSGLTDINPLDNSLKIDDAIEVKRVVGTSLPIFELLAIAVVVVVAVIVIYNVLKRRKKKYPLE